MPPQRKQQESPSAVEMPMQPKPDYGEASYKGAGKLAGKAAVSTGADSGIGHAVAFAREGAAVLVNPSR